jgi:hypothetical protein
MKPQQENGHSVFGVTGRPVLSVCLSACLPVPSFATFISDERNFGE